MNAFRWDRSKVFQKIEKAIATPARLTQRNNAVHMDLNVPRLLGDTAFAIVIRGKVLLTSPWYSRWILGTDCFIVGLRFKLPLADTDQFFAVNSTAHLASTSFPCKFCYSGTSTGLLFIYEVKCRTGLTSTAKIAPFHILFCIFHFFSPWTTHGLH